ncbi:MAG: Asp-tRNA(Asn)/Glu-tRNA(Gln) amidotransferase GatCAB subunit B, partial [Alphaproteobacteria bacterium]|nr:Asp-tRNA(Asn)/Glu-tRNA(Gln) amidotransferase GatCAB subunit B [Alphaproteobacteria bacterium]
MLLEGKTGKWEIVCGLEIHCQIISKSKIFSSASTHFGSDTNQNVSFVDAGMPGMLPTLNEECVRQAVKTGLGLRAVINKYSEFSRKNYFYADLPQGYQITQFVHPIVGEGVVT